MSASSSRMKNIVSPVHGAGTCPGWTKRWGSKPRQLSLTTMVSAKGASCGRIFVSRASSSLSVSTGHFVPIGVNKA
eukprot:1584256-Pyramimonas_sp.AAC.1